MKATKGILYSVIARSGTILVEEVNRNPHVAHSGNYMQVVHILIPKLPKDGNHTYQYDKWVTRIGCVVDPTRFP